MKPHNTQINEALSSNAEETIAVANDERQLQKRQHQFKAAIGFLKKTLIHTPREPNTNKKEKLFNLPWVLLMGTSDTGKTTLLEQSGLKFVLSKKNPDPTLSLEEHCVWWSTRETVFLDLNSHYTTEKAYRKLWVNFLTLLRKNKRVPLNGLVLTISLASLANQSKKEQDAYFVNLRKRIQDLQKILRADIPLYIVFTKTDLLAGFNEFFEPLTKEEREQAWGLHFSRAQVADQQHIADAFDTEYDMLLDRLNERLITRLHQERSQKKRAQIKDFPLQMESLKQSIAILLKKVSSVTTAKQSTKLRGIYFTSTETLSTPIATIDRLLPKLEKTFELMPSTESAPKPQSKTFFTYQLFKDIIFSDLVAFSQQEKQPFWKRPWLRFMTMGAAAVLILSLTPHWTQKFSRQMSDITALENRFSQYQWVMTHTDLTKLDQLVPALNLLVQTTTTFQNIQLPWLTQHIMKSPKQLNTSVQSLYGNTVQMVLKKQLETILQTQLQSDDAPDADLLYGALKTYLALGDKAHYNPQRIESWLTQYWRTEQANDANYQGQMKKHLHNFLTSYTPSSIKLDQTLITTTRNRLNALPLSDLGLAILNNDLIQQQPVMIIPWPQHTTFIKEKQPLNIPDIYTRQSFDHIYQTLIPQAAKTIMTGNWIIGGKLNMDADYSLNIITHIRSAYTKNYIATWQEVIDQINISQRANLKQTIQLLDQLTRANSDMDHLFQIIHNNTALSTTRQTPVELHFSAFNDFYQAIQNKSSILGSALPQVQRILSQIAGAKNPDHRAFMMAKQRFETHPSQADVFDLLTDYTQQSHQQTAGWIAAINANSWKLILEGAERHTTHVWQTTLLPDYQKKIAHKYPLSKKAKKEIQLKDFSTFFAPKGKFETYFDNYLANFVDKKASPWQWRELNGQTLGLPRNILMQFERTTFIRSAFFPQNSAEPNVSFQLTPEHFKPSMKGMTFNLDNQQVNFTKDDLTPKTLQWPGKLPMHSVTMSFKGLQGKTETEVGAWAWFKLLDKAATIETLAPHKLKVSFRQGNELAEYDLSTGKRINPFSPDLLRSLKMGEG